MTKPLINLADLPWQESDQGDFQVHRKSLAHATGGEQIGTSLYKLAPGKKAFPYHAHTANEEAIFVLEGEGCLRYNDHEYPVQANDYIALPSGRSHAHQLINTSEKTLTYLCISTMHSPDVMFYPDSNKIGIMAGSAPGGVKTEDSYKAFFHQEDDVDYFDREK